MPIMQIDSPEELEQVYQKSESERVVLFKHSNTCPISTNAYHEIEQVAKKRQVYMIVVQESRSLSQRVAEDLEITHQSPQAFILEQRRAIWNASHQTIKEQTIIEQLSLQV